MTNWSQLPNKKGDLAKVAYTGKYTDLLGLPTIGDGVVTIYQGEYRDEDIKGRFSMNQTGNVDILIEQGISTVDWSDITNRPDFADVAYSGSYNDLLDKPTIPTVGTLNTDISSAQPVNASESLSGSISLHKISKTGSYNDLLEKPDLSLKADKVSGAVSGNFAGLDSTGNLVDSGYDASDFASSSSIGNSKIFYGTCSTATATAVKEVACPDFTSADLVDGAIVNVKFDYTNGSAVGSLKLNVNGTGEYPIKKIYNAAINNLTSTNELFANSIIQFVFTGSYWLVSGVDYNNTYSGMTYGEIYDGTSTAGRTLYAKLLIDTFDILNGNTIKMRGDTVTVPPQLVAGTDLEIVPVEGILPSGYTQLQYIGTNKDAWFLSDLKVGDFDKVTTDIVLLDRGSSAGASYSPSVFGSSTNASTVATNCKALRLYYSTGNWIFGYYGSTYSISNWAQNSTEGIDLGVLTSIEIGLKSGEQYIKKNGTVIAQNASTATLTNNYNVAILGHNIAGTVKYIGKLLCHSMTFYLDNVAVANYIPARRNSDNAVGMYDLVTDTFHVSEGTGQFTAGNDVIPDNVINFTNDTGYITEDDVPQSDWDETDNTSPAYILNKPTIPTVGTLNTDNSTAQSVNASESLSGSISLHKISKTGSYNDLLDKPTAVGYWANVQTTASASYIKEPEVKSVTINGSSTDAASTDHCTLVYDTVNKCLKFTF